MITITYYYYHSHVYVFVWLCVYWLYVLLVILLIITLLITILRDSFVMFEMNRWLITINITYYYYTNTQTSKWYEIAIVYVIKIT